METKEPSFIKSLAVQLTAILITALGAAAVTLVQSIAVQSGACPSAPADPAQAGLLGALFKSAHSALLMKHGTMS